MTGLAATSNHDLKRRFRSYPEYQDSGVEWLGNIPSSWETRRLKNVLVCKITDGPHTTPVFIPDGVPFLSVDGIQDGELVFDGCRYVSKGDHEEYTKKAFPRRGDILFGKAASTGKIARVKVDFEFSIWSPLALIRVSEEHALASFIECALKSPAVQAQIDVLCTSNTQKNISMDDIPLLTFALPPHHEQRAIAGFLDRETGRIDELIAKKQRLIELLAEKRTALISHAVTKGLNPDAPMKDSGVEWLGQIPKHWSAKRLKFLVDALGPGIQMGPFGSMLTHLQYENTGFKLYGQENTIRNDFDLGTRWLLPEQFASLRKYELRPGDIVLTRKGSIGQSRIVPNGIVHGIADSDTIRIRLDGRHALAGMLVRVLHDAPYLQSQIQATRRGAILSGLNTATIADLWIAVPPLHEQNDIVTHLSTLCGHVGRLVHLIHTAIGRLREYRSALISAAVTGKIDVRKEGC